VQTSGIFAQQYQIIEIKKKSKLIFLYLIFFFNMCMENMSL